jgi:hypothetical protein
MDMMRKKVLEATILAALTPACAVDTATPDVDSPEPAETAVTASDLETSGDGAIGGLRLLDAVPGRDAVAPDDLDMKAVRERAGLPSSAVLVGPFYIRNDHSLKCLNVAGGSLADRAPVIQFTCPSSISNDLWWLDDQDHIINVHSAKCLNVAGGVTTDRAAVIQFTCGSAVHNDQWHPGPAGHIINDHSSKCLNVAGGATTDRAAVIQFTCGSAVHNDEWTLFPL